MNDHQKKAFHQAADEQIAKYRQSPIANHVVVRIFEAGFNEVLDNPEKYGLGTWPVLAEKLEILTEENAQLREALLTIANWTYELDREHDNPGLFAEKALKGGDTCKP